MERHRIQTNSHRPRQKQGVGDSLKRISDYRQHPQQQQQREQPSSFSSPRSTSHLPPVVSSSSNATGTVGGNVDRVLFNNLVEMVPLVETLMDRRGNSSFTRRASMIYTPNPSHSKKCVESKARRAIQITSEKKQEIADNISDEHNAARKNDNGDDEFSLFSSSSIGNGHFQKDREDIYVLHEQVASLEKKLIEKDDCIKSAKTSLASVEVTLDEMRNQVTEKDALVKSFHSELNNTKIKLADKQAALEKLEWMVGETNNKVEKLQIDIDSRDFEITALMQFFEQLTRNSRVASPSENNVYLDHFDYLPNIDMDEIAVEKARLAYEEALAFAKNDPSDEALSVVSEARIKLKSFIV